jgi:hypothetical protein
MFLVRSAFRSFKKKRKEKNMNVKEGLFGEGELAKGEGEGG